MVLRRPVLPNRTTIVPYAGLSLDVATPNYVVLSDPLPCRKVPTCELHHLCRFAPHKCARHHSACKQASTCAVARRDCLGAPKRWVLCVLHHRFQAKWEGSFLLQRGPGQGRRQGRNTLQRCPLYSTASGISCRNQHHSHNHRDLRKTSPLASAPQTGSKSRPREQMT